METYSSWVKKFSFFPYAELLSRDLCEKGCLAKQHAMIRTCLQIRHDNTVTWLAFWKDPISTKDFKYVWLAANSVFKSDSDLAKYEKARKLKVRLLPKLHLLILPRAS